MNQFDRFVTLIGEGKLSTLQKSHVLVVGLGGVGGHVVETLVRSGIGELTIVDCDTFELSNLNRQILATHSTIGKSKVDVCELRCRDINPKIKVHKKCEKFSSLTKLDFSKFCYVVDAVDDVEAKFEIIKRAKEANVNVISCMGTANKFDPTKLQIADISHSSVCPLASIIRKKCRESGIKDVKCAFSTEPPKKNGTKLGSTAFVPSVAGILIGQTVILDLIKE